jgi:hypothetical protein
MGLEILDMAGEAEVTSDDGGLSPDISGAQAASCG